MLLSKGQTISIRLLPPITPNTRPGGAQNFGAATGGSLLSRISGGNAPAVVAPRGARGGIMRGGSVEGFVGVSSKLTRRSGGRGRGAPAGRGRQAPASSGDLDKELDSFMKTDAVST